MTRSQPPMAQPPMGQVGSATTQAAVTDPARLAAVVESMPPFPAALLRVRRVLGDATTSSDDLIASVAMDARLSVAVMRLANSARYGVSERRFSLAQSIGRIGRSELRALVDALSLQQLFRGAAADAIVIGEIWGFSLQGAFAARHWAAHLPGQPADRDEAFSVALFRDLGRIVADGALAEAGVGADLYAQPQQRLRAERELLGYTHAALSAALVAHWGFGEAVALAIGGHHDTPLVGSGEALALVAQLGDRTAVAVALAGRVAPGAEAEAESASGEAWPDPYPGLQPQLDVLLPDSRAAWDAIVAAPTADLSAYSALLAA